MYAHQLATAVCSRSSIRADDTPAVQELTPDDPGAPSLATMTKISCTDGVLAEEVRGGKNEQTAVYLATLLEKHVYMKNNFAHHMP